MIDEWNKDRTGWARFSDDRRYRYRLARALTPRAQLHQLEAPRLRVVTFVMLNPSTADAFKLDRTVERCVEFARRWGADVLEVANLFALRSPKPIDLYRARHDTRGGAGENDEHILEACRGAWRVVAAWGNHAYRARLSSAPAARLRPEVLRGYSRGHIVRAMLERAGVELYYLGLTRSGAPIHPHARGKHRVPYEREPVRWVPWRERA